MTADTRAEDRGNAYRWFGGFKVCDLSTILARMPLWLAGALD